MLDRHLRPKAGPWLEASVERHLKRGTKPDTLTLLSLLLALGAGLLFYVAPALTLGPGWSLAFNLANLGGLQGGTALEARHPLLLLAGLLVLLSGGYDALDGALARKVGPTKRGDFLDHAFDRFADVLLLGGIVFGGYAPLGWGFAALAATLLTSYLGTQAQALGLGRTYGGILGRLDRLLAIPVAAGLQFLLPGTVSVPGTGVGFTLLGWMVVGFTVLGGVTVVQRFGEVWRKLKADDSKNP